MQALAHPFPAEFAPRQSLLIQNLDLSLRFPSQEGQCDPSVSQEGWQIACWPLRLACSPLFSVHSTFVSSYECLRRQEYASIKPKLKVWVPVLTLLLIRCEN